MCIRDRYIDGFGQYLKDREENSVALSGFDGAAPLKEAAAVIKGQIDRGMPVPYLLLKHKDPLLKDFVWHWFLLVGYEDFEDTFMVKTVTYGEYPVSYTHLMTKSTRVILYLQAGIVNTG